MNVDVISLLEQWTTLKPFGNSLGQKKKKKVCPSNNFNQVEGVAWSILLERILGMDLGTVEEFGIHCGCRKTANQVQSIF